MFSDDYFLDICDDCNNYDDGYCYDDDGNLIDYCDICPCNPYISDGWDD